MTPERLAEIRHDNDAIPYDIPAVKELCDEVERLQAALAQCSVDAERWRVVLKILDGHYRHPDTHKWLVQFDEALDGTMMPIHDLFTADIDALRTQKAPG